MASHTCQLVHVFETVLKNTLRYHTGSICKRKCNSHLRLHIRRKSRIRQSLDVCMSLYRFSYHTDCIIKFNHFTADLNELGRNSFQMLRDHIFHHDIPSGCCCSTHKSTCFDLIRDNRILGSMKLAYATDTDSICTSTFNIGSHTI